MANLLYSFDLGTNSIGWCVFGLDAQGNPNAIADIGARIFSDGREPKSGTSLAVGRRTARAMSRRRDRGLRRKDAVLRTLTEYGLMPSDKATRKMLVQETGDGRSGIANDVYALRTRALDEKLPAFHIGRALFHLNQRRGFKSNRKTDRRDNDQGKIAQGISALKASMDDAGARTLGEFLCKRRGDDPRDRGWVRVRNQVLTVEDGKEKEGYRFYPERALLEDEFVKIWDKQAGYYSDVMTEERRAHLFRVMFYQRPLKRPLVGKCSFNPAEERLAKAHPLFQQFRLYKEVNELRIDEGAGQSADGRALTLEERDRLINQLNQQKTATYASLRNTLKLPPGQKFKKESDSRDKMLGDEVRTLMSDKTRFGNRWFDMKISEQWQVIEKLREEEDPLALHAWLAELYGYEPERCDAIADAPLPEGYGRLGSTAITSMLEEFKTDVIPESRAATLAGYDHSLARHGDGMDDLPNYQEVLERRIPPGSGEESDPYDVRMGRITNPTVHIALNQLRRVLNALIHRHGKPVEIAVELARDLKLSEDQKKEVNRTITRNTRDAEARSQKLVELGQPDSGYNRALLKFWEGLGDDPVNRVCVYCGDAIGPAKLFSGDVDIDHILPWSKTLDDSQANRILCCTRCNREKGNNAPVDVPQWQGRYDEIIERAGRLPKNKVWRFARDAMQKYEGDQDFLARQMTDTQYLSRLAHEYLGALYPDEEPDQWGVFSRRNHIRVVPGRLTSMLRRKWGLDGILQDSQFTDTGKTKNRKDHRHHAIDAAVVGVTTRGLLNRISQAAGRGEELGMEDVLNDMPVPWDGFRDDLARRVAAAIVSHKPDHGTLPKPGEYGQTAGRLHNDTAYGITDEQRKGVPVVVRRKPFLSLDVKDIALIRDEELQARLYSATSQLTGKEFTAALLRFQQTDEKYRGIRRVRLEETLSVIPISDRQGKAYKGYKGDANYRYDVWELLNGKWMHEVVSMFDAHRPGRTSAVRDENPTARKVLSLQQNDMVAYDHPDKGPTFARVVKFSQGGQVTFAPHNEGGALKARDADKGDPFRYFYKSAGTMKIIGLRRVRIDEIGYVADPGPQDRQSRADRKRQAG